MSKQSNNYQVVFAIGAALLVAGLALSYYPNSVIAGLEGNLNYQSLSIEDRWMYQGSLNWWNVEKLTVYQPLSYLIVFGGAFTMGGAILSACVGLVRFYIFSKHPPPQPPLVKEEEKPLFDIYKRKK
jgi:hypothetical protein